MEARAFPGLTRFELSIREGFFFINKGNSDHGNSVRVVSWGEITDFARPVMLGDIAAIAQFPIAC